MHYSQSDYSLKSLLNLCFARRWFLIRCTLLSLLLGGIFYFLFPHQYKAETVFILKNPLFADRGNIYSEPKGMNYFANEDEITRFIALANYDSLKTISVQKFNLFQVYKLDSNKVKDRQKILELFSKSLILYRAESNDIVLLFNDKNAERAAQIANFYVPLIEQSFRGFYNEMRINICNSLKLKIVQQDSIISAYTDTLIIFRERYKIYDIINPSRHNLMSGAMNPSGRTNFAEGLELIQNIESIKDELVSDRAYKHTLLSQYNTGNNLSNQSLVKIIKTAQVPLKREGIGLIGMMIICTFFGFCVSLVYVVILSKLDIKK